MDRCAIHLDNEVRRIIEYDCGRSMPCCAVAWTDGDKRAAKLLYLPPQSPHLNPLHQFFFKLEAWLFRDEEQILTPKLIEQTVLSIAMEHTLSCVLNCGYT